MVSSWPATPAPPDPVEPPTGTILAGTVPHRVHENDCTTVRFHPGGGAVAAAAHELELDGTAWIPTRDNSSQAA